jgi:DNA primase
VQSRTRPLAITLLSNSQNANDEAKDDTKSFRIPPEQLELIKESADIVSVVESYGLPGFKRHGDNRALAICPFHNDHNPSMSIDGQRGIYKCFACGAGGDVFNFVREYSALQSEPMTFYQAVRHVAQEFTDQNLKLDVSSSSSITRMTNEERKALKEKKER